MLKRTFLKLIVGAAVVPVTVVKALMAKKRTDYIMFKGKREYWSPSSYARWDSRSGVFHRVTEEQWRSDYKEAEREWFKSGTRFMGTYGRKAADYSKPWQLCYWVELKGLTC